MAKAKRGVFSLVGCLVKMLRYKLTDAGFISADW